jgi:hypothetical protein
MIVATYSFYEKAFKKLLSLTNKLTTKQLDSCYKKSEAKKNLKNKFNIDYEKLADYKKIEELRCLNNAIKHNGTVGKELHNANAKWKLNTHIENTYDEFKRLQVAPTNLLTDLRTKLLTKI